MYQLSSPIKVLNGFIFNDWIANLSYIELRFPSLGRGSEGVNVGSCITPRWFLEMVIFWIAEPKLFKLCSHLHKKIIWFLESFRSEMYGRIAIKVWVWCFLLLLSIRLLKFRNFNLFMLSFQWATDSKSNARCLVDYHSWQQNSCIRVMISDQITDYLSDEN